MRFKKTMSTLAAIFVLHASAQANVIYEWKDVNHKAPYGINLRLEFDDAAFKAGTFSFHLDPEQPGLPRPDSQLLYLSYSFAGAHDTMTYFPRKGGFAQGRGFLDMDVTFEPGGFLTGTISANNTEHDFSMISQGRVFTVIAHSDEGMTGAGCVENAWGCSGATGQMRYVPEPGSLALFLAGGLGSSLLLVVARRKLRMRTKSFSALRNYGRIPTASQNPNQ